MLTFAFRFATSKMLIYLQKRFGGIDRLTAIWLKFQTSSKQSLSPKIL
jgi:hypothetical protein